MEDICDWPTDMAISVQPDGDSWKVNVVQEGSVDDAAQDEWQQEHPKSGGCQANAKNWQLGG